MRIKKFYLPILTAVMLTACSADDEASKTETVNLDNSPVQIRLSVMRGHQTRSSIESNDDGLFKLDGLGIFMLATDIQTTNPEEDPITWKFGSNAYEPNSDYTNPWAVWMENVAANAVMDDENAPTRTDIVWCDNITRWYPVGNWYSYRFYGYYPRVEMDQIEVTDTRRCVNYTGLDGTKDIIWGTSAGADMNNSKEKYRYSGRYFRQLGYADKNPEIAFEHKMMRLQFCIQGVPDENADEADKFLAANDMIIDTIIVEKVPTVASLIIADIDSTKNGKISYDWVNNLAPLGVIGQNDGVFVKEQIQNDSIIKVGQPILLPVLDADATAANYIKYKIIVRLKNTSGDMFNHEKPIELRMNNTYQPGKSYRVVLQIAGPKQVTASATLRPWDIDNDTNDPTQDSVAPLVFD